MSTTSSDGVMGVPKAPAAKDLYSGERSTIEREIAQAMDAILRAASSSSPC